MAIKRTKEKAELNIPAPLAGMLSKGFTEQFMASKFEALFKETKVGVVKYLESNTDGFDADLGKGFKCEEGTVIYTSRKNIKIDGEKLAAAVKAGKLSVEQLIACISTYKNEDLEKSLSTPVFKEMATESSTESLTFRGSAEFKAELEAKMGGTTSPTPSPITEELEAIPAKPAAKDPKSAAKAAAAAVAKAKAKSKSADDDLDSILGGK